MKYFNINKKGVCYFVALILILSSFFITVFTVSANENDRKFYFIEFEGIPSMAKREQLSMNMKFHRYLGSGNFVCEIPTNFIQTISNSKLIRNIKMIEPEDKLTSDLLNSNGDISIILSTYDINDVDYVSKMITRKGGVVTEFQDVGVSRIWATVPSSMIDDIANIPEVFMIENDIEATTFMDKITTTTYMGMDAPQTGGFTGSGIMGEVQDSGCELTHPDFSVDYYDGSISTQSHGTCTYGIVFSLGTNNIATQGTLYDATSVFADYADNTQYTSISHLWNGQFTSGNAGQNGLFQSNSWGHLPMFGYGGYNSYTAESDQASNDFPNLLVLWAAANSNNGVQKGSLSYESQAKNGLTVGAIWHKDTASMTDDEWLNGGSGNTPSQGPCPDGRQKPDVVGPFDWIYCSDVTGSGGYASGDYYSDFGGTSGSTPCVAGIVGQTYEMYIENHFGNNPGGTIPSSALIKAIVIADAYQYSLNDADRDSQGWGSADAEQIYTLGSTYHVMDDDISVSPGGSWSRTVTSDGTMPLKISLVWNDPAASESTGSGRALLNNLDLKVTAPDGTTVWWGNNGLYTNLWSTSGTGLNQWTRNSDYRDDENNVENVFIQNPTAGTYTIEVFGRSGDMYSSSQNFAVVAAGAQGITFTPPSIQIFTPNGGEIIQAGTTYDITWSTTAGDGAITDVDLEYSTDNGGSWNTIITGTADDGLYSWNVPDDPSTQCLVKGIVHDDNSMTGTDTSDALFEILGIPPGAPSNLIVEHYGVSSVEDVANSVTINQGNPNPSYDYTYTHEQDDSYHQITEIYVGGPRNRGKYSLDIVYPISITGGSGPYTLMIDAYRDDSESYSVSYQVNNGGYTTLGQLSAGSDTDTYLSWQLSNVGAGDTVDVRIIDTQEGVGETIGTLYIDHLYIQSTGSGSGTDDNKLTWNASPDDGSGVDDVAYYNVYQSTINGEPWNYIGQVTADNSASYTYIDSDKGTADTTQWWYVVRAEDASGLESSNSNSAQEPGIVNNPPNAPTNPSPANGATGVSINPTLSVDVSDPDGNSMDVSFYDASDDSLIGTDTGVASGGTASVTWSGRSYLMTYNWYTVANDGLDTTQSATWSFTTMDEPVNTPPDAPTNPTPADGSTGVQLSPTISVYVNDADGDTMTVSFYQQDGTFIGSETVTGSGTASVVFTNADQYSTTYYWYAVADDGIDSTTSVTWSFTTEQEPQVGGMYVWDISWSSAGPHLKSLVTIKVDSDNDGIAEISDNVVSGATVYYTLTNQDTTDTQSITGTTDSNGQIEFMWKQAPRGYYEGLVTNVIHSSYTYNSALDVDNPDYYTH